MRVYIRKDVFDQIKRDLERGGRLFAQGNFYNQEGPIALGLVECGLVVKAIQEDKGVMPWWGSRRMAVDIRHEHEEVSSES